jgi:cysteine desulfurase
MIDLDRVRADTPGCLSQVFLDSAGSSLPPSSVVSAVVDHVRREAEVGGYRAAAERAEDLRQLPRTLGRLLSCDEGAIALSDSGSRAWSQFLTALPLRAGDRVLVTGTEYASNAIALLQRARADGVSVEVVPSTATGEVDLAELALMLDERVRLVSLVHVPTNGGLVNPVREVVELAHGVGSRVILDACQSVGQLQVDVQDLQVDALSASGRKWLRGPRGTGFLYVRPELAEELEPAVADLRGAEWTGPASYRLLPGAARFEFWEADIAARLGLMAAVALLLELGPAEVEAAVRARASQLRRALSSLPDVRVRDVGDDLCGIVSFTVEGADPVEVRDALGERGVTMSVSWASSTRIDMAARGLESVLRASPHYFVTEGEIDRAAEAVARLP